MRFFKQVQTIEELKKEFRKLAFIHHPDCGGDPESMKQLNLEYEIMFKKLQTTSTNKKDHAALEDDFREVIDKLINIMDIEIEICGTWVWISGDTKPNAAKLKEAGFRWASKKLMWYWHSPEEKTYSRGKKTMDQIREVYGSSKVERNFQPSLS